MAATSVPTIYRSESQPQWGRGTVTEEAGDKVVVVFEHESSPKTFKKAMLDKGLTAVEMTPNEARELEEKLRGKRRPAVLTSAEKKKRDEKKAKTSAAKRATASFATFEAQLERFTTLYPDGFADERFISEERGDPKMSGKGGFKEAAMALVQTELTAAKFDDGVAGELFDAAKKAIQLANIAFPMEGAIPFGNIAEDDRGPMLTALKELLHGTSDYSERFEAFIKSLKLKDKQGKAKAATWPIATLLPALNNPSEHVAVKPTAFASQAALLGQDLQKSQALTGAGYARFLDVAKRTQELLTNKGQKPRDLMDVYSFISRTHSEKAAKPPKA